MHTNDIQNGTHFWAKMDEEIVMMCRGKYGFYVCGAWEQPIISSDEFEFIQAVDLPKGYSVSDLYYQ